MNKKVILVLLVLVIFAGVSLAVILKPASAKVDLTDNTVLGRPNPFAQAAANLTGKPFYNPALDDSVVFPDYWVVRVGGK